MKKKLLVLVLCIILVVAMAIPAFAAVGVGTQKIYGWGGTNSIPLFCSGSGQTIQLLNTSTTQWTVIGVGNGRYRITDASKNLDVNIYRVLQPNNYYYCTAYTYDSATHGVDQLVRITQIGSGRSMIQLSDPVMGGSWYMMADRSAPSSQSDVIWYQDSSGTRAQWM